jgi:hypothetical protein
VSWAGVITAIDANLVAAGATLTPIIDAIRQGEPDAVDMPLIAYWYGGDRESQTGGNTFGKTNLEELVYVRIYFPGSIRADSLDSSLEVRIRNAKAAVLHALWGDASLGGNAIGLDVQDTTSGWAAVGNALCRVVELAIWVDLAELDDIIP